MKITEKLVNKVLLRAADLIEKEGFSKGMYRSHTGCFCALGAIRQAVKDVTGVVPLIPLPSIGGVNGYPIDVPGGPSVVSWNDAKERTAEDVVRTLRETALAGNTSGGSNG